MRGHTLRGYDSYMNNRFTHLGEHGVGSCEMRWSLNIALRPIVLRTGISRVARDDELRTGFALKTHFQNPSVTANATALLFTRPHHEFSSVIHHERPSVIQSAAMNLRAKRSAA